MAYQNTFWILLAFLSFETGVISAYGMAGVSLPGNPVPFIHRLKMRNEFMIESDHTFASFEQKSVSTGQKSSQEMKITPLACSQTL